jgi:hypothetical protein
LDFTKHPETPKGFKTVVLSTKELYSASEVLPNLKFQYHTTPLEALHPREQEAAKREYEAKVEALNGQASERKVQRLRRRLQSEIYHHAAGGVVASPSAPVKAWNSFAPVKGTSAATDMWKPLSHANFGWNWDYKTHTVRNPQFRFLLPGMRGYVLLKNPYLKFLGMFHINFTSNWDKIDPFKNPPIVQMNVHLEGNAHLNADLSLMANVYKNIANNPLSNHAFHIPLLDHWTKETHYFKRLRFFVANIPINIQPGVRCGLTAYHIGLFQGAVRAGLNMKVRVSAQVLYDSRQGASVNFKADALQVKFLPPTWLVFTKHLEIGALLAPSFWLRGGIGRRMDTTITVEVKPYANASIMQEGEAAYGPQQQVLQKELVIYPFRAINLPAGQEWSVGIQANGYSKMTSTAVSMGGYSNLQREKGADYHKYLQTNNHFHENAGVIEYRDWVPHFRFGLINQRKLLKEPIYVVLFRGGTEQVGPAVPVYCEAIVNGECQPSPSKAFFTINGQPVVVQLTIAWHHDAVQFLKQQIRVMSIVFPRFALSPEATNDFRKGGIPQRIFVRFIRNGRVYHADATHRQVRHDLVEIDTRYVQNLGIQWIHAWRVKYGAIEGQEQLTELIEPQIELVYVRNGKNIVVAKTFLPPVHWGDHCPGFSNPAPIHNNAGEYIGNIRLDMSMWKAEDRFGQIAQDVEKFVIGGPRNHGAPYISATMGLAVHNPQRATRFINPRSHLKWTYSMTHPLVWSLRAGIVGQRYDFELAAYRVDPNNGDLTQIPLNENINPSKIKAVCQSPPVKYNSPFADYGDACHFEQPLKPEPNLAGLNVIFKLIWKQNPLEEQMFSPAVSFVHSPGGRRLADSAEFSTPGDPDPDSRHLRIMEENGNIVVAPVSSKEGVDFNMEEVPPEDREPYVQPQSVRKTRKLQATQGSYSQSVGYQPSNINFTQKMAELHPICSKKNLHYQLGMGLYFRARVRSFHLPRMPQLGALSTPLSMLAGFANGLDTGDRSIWNTDAGQDLAKLLPKDVCKLGVCSGVLPGCPGQLAPTITIPKIEFAYNRPMYWDANASAAAKNAVAYAMSLFPEAVRIGSLVVKSLLGTTTTTQINGDVFNSGDVIWIPEQAGGQPCRWIAKPICSESFYYKGHKYIGCTMIDNDRLGWCSTDSVFNGDWRNCDLKCRAVCTKPGFYNEQACRVAGGTWALDTWVKDAKEYIETVFGRDPNAHPGRRLEDEIQESENAQEDKPVETDRIVVEFDRDAVHYNIDEDLVHDLIRRQAFRGVGDAKGEAHIVGFRVHTGTTEPGELSMIPVGPTESFEHDFAHREIRDEPSKFIVKDEVEQQNIAMESDARSMPLTLIVAGVAVFAMLSIVVGMRMAKHQSGAAYVSVEAME